MYVTALSNILPYQKHPNFIIIGISDVSQKNLLKTNDFIEKTYI